MKLKKTNKKQSQYNDKCMIQENGGGGGEERNQQIFLFLE
jgi:hypothetical protein